MTKILVLDDDALIRWNASERLANEGFEVVEAVTNDEAIGHLREGGIDGALLDWNLNEHAKPIGPYTDETIAFAQKMDIPVVIRTGTDDSTGRLSGILAKAKGSVIKVDKAEPLEVLSSYFRR